MKRPVTGLVHDERLVLLMDEWDRRAAEMNSRTKRRSTKYKLGEEDSTNTCTFCALQCAVFCPG